MSLRLFDVKSPDLDFTFWAKLIGIVAVAGIVGLFIVIKLITVIVRNGREASAEKRKREAFPSARVHRESAALDHDQAV